MSIVVEVIADITDEDLRAVNRLIPQLSRSAPPLTAGALARIAGWDGNHLLIARHADHVVGMLTLVTFPIPTGLRAWIEDVVVDEAARGQGVGAALTQEAVRLAGPRAPAPWTSPHARPGRTPTGCTNDSASSCGTRAPTASPASPETRNWSLQSIYRLVGDGARARSSRVFRVGVIAMAGPPAGKFTLAS